MAASTLASESATRTSWATAMRRHRLKLYLALLFGVVALFSLHIIDWVVPRSIFPTLLPWSVAEQLNPRIEGTLASYISAVFFAVLGVIALWGFWQLRGAARATRLGYLTIGLLGLYIMVDEPIGIHEKAARYVDAFMLNVLKIDLSNTPIAEGHSWAIVALPVAIAFLIVCVRFCQSHLRARPALIALAAFGLMMWVYSIVGELLYGTLTHTDVPRILQLEEWTEESSEILGAIFLTMVLVEGVYLSPGDTAMRWWPWQRLWSNEKRHRLITLIFLVGPVAAALAGIAVVAVTGYGRAKLLAMFGDPFETIAVAIVFVYALALYELTTSVGLGLLRSARSRSAAA